MASTTSVGPNGGRIETVTIDVHANVRLDGGVLTNGRTAAAEAGAFETAIERDISKTSADPDGGVTRYVTDVHMTVGQEAEAGREQFVFVSARDPRLGGDLGRARLRGGDDGLPLRPGGGARTAPHEFGHLAGLRHTAQVSLGCVTAPGIGVQNVMSQTGCSPTWQPIERSQLEWIAGTPDFR